MPDGLQHTGTLTLFYINKLINGIPNTKIIASTKTNVVAYLYTSPLVKYSLLPNSIAANGEAAGVHAADNNTVKISRVMIGAGFTPADTQ